MLAKPFSVLLAATFLSGSAIVAVSADEGRRSDLKADPAAYALLKVAHDHRDSFPAHFPGLSADLTLNDNGKEVSGTLTYTSAGKLTVTLNDATQEEKTWAREELGSAFGHRHGSDFAHGDGSNPISFGEDDHSPLGKLVELNDGMKSSYRVKDGQITEVNRSMGPMRFTITVLANKSVEGGKTLPDQFVVTYFDAATGAIKQVDEFSDRYEKVGSAWVPVWRRVVTAKDGEFVTHTLTLSHVRPEKP